MAAFQVGVPGNRRRTGGEVLAHPPGTCRLILCFPVSQKSATYAANGQREAHRVQHRGGDGAVVEGVLDAVIATEKAPLVRLHLTQVKGRQRQTPCGWRDQEEGEVKGRQQEQKQRLERLKKTTEKTHQSWSSGD